MTQTNDEVTANGGQRRHAVPTMPYPAASKDKVSEAPARWTSKEPVEVGSLPPLAVLLARPVLLLICAVLGTVAGVLLVGNSGYKATVVLQYTTAGSDSTLVKQTGETIARVVLSDATLTNAEARIGAGTSLDDRVDAEWVQDSQLVSVTVTADTARAAANAANAVAFVVVDDYENAISERIAAAGAESQNLLSSGVLTSEDAERARVSQLGASLAVRQDAIAGQSGGLFLADTASDPTVAGLTRTMGGIVGLVGGLLIGALAALLLGVRGLRVSSGHTLRQLFPADDLSSQSQVAELAGQFIESGKNVLAVVVPRDAEIQGETIAASVADFVRAHGWTAKVAGLDVTQHWPDALSVLRWDVRENVREEFGVDVMIVVVAAGTPACDLLQGQSNLGALVVAIRRRTRITTAISLLRGFRRADPTLVLAR